MMSKILFIHAYEEFAFREMKKEIHFENQLEYHYENYVLPANSPDLFGKTVQVNNKQFRDIFETAQRIADYLNIPVPEIYVFESFFYTVESKGTDSNQWIEISSKTIADLPHKEITFLLAKELAAIKLRHTHYYALINEYLNALKNNVSFTGIGTATAIIKVKMYSWARISNYTSDNFAYLYCGNIKICFNAITKTVLNDIFLVENINIPELMKQAERINSLNSDIHNFSKSDELIPYVPFRLKNLIAYASSSRGADALKLMSGGEV